MPFSLKLFEQTVKTLKKHSHDDWIDRLNNYHIVSILIFFAGIITAKQMVGSPINCWSPAEFKKDWENYAETYCFVSETYYLPLNTTLPAVSRQKISLGEKKIGYYQWIPFILLVQAFLFYLPHVIQKFLIGLTGINVESILQMANQSAGLEPDKRATNIRIIGGTIRHTLRVRWALGNRSTLSSFFRSFFGIDRLRGPDNLLYCAYIFMKVLNCVNVIGQFYFVDIFLGAGQWFSGGRILIDFINGRDWTESGRFPRITLCDFTTRSITGESERHTIQCLLSINIWNEKIFLLIWCLLVLTAVCNCWNLLGWLYSGLSSSSKSRLVQKYLMVGLPINRYEFDNVINGHLFEKFMRESLKSDGVLLLRFISGHAGDLITTEVVTHMFEDFIESCRQNRSAQSSMNQSMIEPNQSTSKPIKLIENGIYEMIDSGKESRGERYRKLMA